MNLPECPEVLSLRNILSDWQRLGLGHVSTELKDVVNKNNLSKDSYETTVYMKFGFDFNDSDLLLTVIQDASSNNVVLEYVQYEGPEVSKPSKAPPRKVVKNSDESEEEIPMVGRGRRLNNRNGIETDYENIKPKNKPAIKQPRAPEEKKETFRQPSTRRNKKLSP